MEFNVRSLNSEDYKILVEWWKEWKWPILPKEALPSNGTGGIMVYKKDILVFAVFLYWSNSTMVLLDWIISNPKYKENDRQEAIEVLIKSAEDMVKAQGGGVMMSISRSKSLLKTHKTLGWNIETKPSYEMTKVILPKQIKH